MRKLLRKHFLPHPGNNHRPHFLHGPNARKIVFFALVVELLFFLAPQVLIFRAFDIIATVLPATLNHLTNEKRLAVNLGELTTNPLLVQAAEMKVKDMAARGYFSHNTPEGLTPWYWLGQAGYRYAIAGENLAVNFSDSRDVTEAWMNSPTHRDNILRQGFTEIGTAVAQGFYEGREAIFVVQYYGKSQPAPTQVATPAPQPTPTIPTPQPTPTPSPTPSVVLGEETAQTSTTSQPAPVTVSDTENNQIRRPMLIEEAVASPRHTLNGLLIGMLSVVILAMTINLITRVNRLHPDLVTNGLAVGVIIFGIYLANVYVLNPDPIISLEIAFSSAEL